MSVVQVIPPIEPVLATSVTVRPLEIQRNNKNLSQTQFKFHPEFMLYGFRNIEDKVKSAFLMGY